MEYDRTLKRMLQSPGSGALRVLTGTQVERWLNTELQAAHSPRVDLLGQAADGELLHIELQSTNDPMMAHRMAEYGLAIARNHKRFPRQVVLYVGREPLTMSNELAAPDVSFRYRLIDMCKVDGDRLLARPEVSDNVIGILGRLANSRLAVRQLVERIAGLEPDGRLTYLRSSLILGGLRGLTAALEEEANKMPLLNDILENPFFAREYTRGLERGKAEGKAEGELHVLRRMLEKRFGPIPANVEQRLAEASLQQIEAWADAVLDARSIEEVLASDRAK